MLNERFEIVFANPRTEAMCRSMLPQVRQLIENGDNVADVEHAGTRYVLRVSEMVGSPAVRFAMVVEPRGVRRPLLDAMERFQLTPREVDVLSMIVDGASNREIAATLHIVEGTVQEHVRNLCRKTQARRRGDLLARIFGIDPVNEADRAPAEKHRDHP